MSAGVAMPDLVTTSVSEWSTVHSLTLVVTPIA